MLPQRNGCSQPNHIPLPILANHSFGFIFKNQFAPNSPFETYRAQSENAFYLCIPSSEMSQINMRIFGLCLRTPKNTELLVFSVTPFKIDQNKKSKPFNRFSLESGNRKKVDMQRHSPRFRSQQFLLWEI